MAHRDEALKSWSKKLGEDHVVSDAAALSQKERATFPTKQKILGVLSPGSKEDVQACLEISNKFKIPLYPLSCGKNWGYGSSVPYSDCALLSLHRLNKITDYNEKLAYVRIEPGVTQKQLSEFLKSKKSQLWVDSTTVGPEASVLGNALDRGHGMTAYADHVAHISDLEVILPTGEILRTGFGRYPNGRAQSLDSYGAGPMLDGLFSQSGLGVVTEGAVWLMPKPETIMAGFVNASNCEELKKLTGLFSELRLRNAIQGGPNFANNVRLIQSYLPYPWETCKPDKALPLSYLEGIKREHSISPWNGSFALYGFKEDVAARAKRIEAFLNEHSIKWMTDEQVQSLKGSKTKTLLENFHLKIFAGMCGEVPDSVNKRLFWKKEKTSQQDPNEEGGGFIWCTFAVPFDGNTISDACLTVENTIREFDFDPDVNIKCIRDRMLHIYASIVYDRDQKDADKNAMLCQKDLFSRMAKKGFYSHRLGVHSMEEFLRVDKNYRYFIEKLKDALDPNHILAPGKNDGR